MSKVFTDVHVFMRSAGQKVGEDNYDQADLYSSLIDEEYREYIDAVREHDDAEIIDACFDMIWVIVGYMHSRGWKCEEIWDEGAKSNLAKIDPVTGKVIRREDGKILKPEGWKPPNFHQFVKVKK